MFHEEFNEKKTWLHLFQSSIKALHHWQLRLPCQIFTDAIYQTENLLGDL